MAGFREFDKGDVLTADDVNDYIMLQSVMVFETEIERDVTLVGLLRPGVTVYVKNTDALQQYSGDSWKRVPTFSELDNVTAESDIKKIILMDVNDPIILYVPDYFLFDGCADEWAVWGFW